MHQLLYISTATPNSVVSTDQILRISRTNNVRDDITGLLFFNGQRFLQALEGPENAIARTIARIRADARHRAIVVLSERTVEVREFGSWSMADASITTDSNILDRIATLVARASPNVQATFNSYARVRRAA